MAKKPGTELLIANISGALTRIRAIIFINLALCAIILSNAYLENFSFDRRQLENSYVRQEQHEAAMRKLETDLQSLTIGADERRLTNLEISKRKFKIDFIKNSRNSDKLNSILVPVVGISIPGNDVNVVCGIFLLFTSIWIVFSINQIRTAFRDEIIFAEISGYLYALRHSLVFIIPESNNALRIIGSIVVAAPAITISIAWINDIISSVENIHILGNLGMWDVVFVRVIFLTAITACLWSISVYSYISWKTLSSKLFEQP